MGALGYNVKNELRHDKGQSRMPFFHLKAANITESGKKKQRYVQSILQPIEQQEGFLFALFDIQEEVATAAPLVTAVVEHLERATQSMTEESHVQHRFEQMIGAINETLLEQSKEETWNIPIEHVNALIGIALDDTIFLTGIGELTALFLHKTPESSYQIFNLFRGIQQEQGHLGWEKPFIAVLDS